MSSLLLIEAKLFKNSIKQICKKKNCEVVILDKDLLKELKKCRINMIILLIKYFIEGFKNIYDN